MFKSRRSDETLRCVNEGNVNMKSLINYIGEVYYKQRQLKDFLDLFQTQVTLNVTITVDRKFVCLNKTEMEKT